MKLLRLFFSICFLIIIIGMLPVDFVFARNDSSMVNDGYGDYVLVPAGNFQMGDNFNEMNRAARPVHTVYLDSFYIGKYEVANAEFSKFIADSGYSDSLYWSAYWYKSLGSQPKYWNDSSYMESRVRGGGIKGNENFPVVGVSRYEAEAYCKWLSRKTGKIYRLPTEAEWEKAARGTDQRMFPWGNDIDEHYANYKDNGDPYDNGLTPVGYFDGSNRNGYQTKNNASPYGAYDMAGNVWEFVSDWYNESYYAVSPSNNPKGPLNPIRVLSHVSSVYGIARGGCYENNSPNSLHSAYRYIWLDDFRIWVGGFRCVREVSYEKITDLNETNENNHEVPGHFNLHQNYPNPFNPQTIIRFQIQRLSDLKIIVYNIMGQEVKTLVNKKFPAGSYEVQWDGTDKYGKKVASGIYLYRMETNTGYIKTRKMVYLK